MENSTNLDIYTLLATICLAILGWIVALALQRKNIRDQHKIQIKYDIYKQFVSLHKEIQDSTSKLGAHISPPFVLMDTAMIPFELKLKKEYKDQWIQWGEQECVLEGEKKWTAYVQESYKLYSKFSDKFLNMLYVTEDWAAALRPLLLTKKILFKEIASLQKQIHEQLGILQAYKARRLSSSYTIGVPMTTLHEGHCMFGKSFLSRAVFWRVASGTGSKIRSRYILNSFPGPSF